MFDMADEGVQPIYRTPNPYIGDVFGPQAQLSFLADGQNQFAWAAYIDMSYDVADDVELSLNMRYDNDHRENTTLTPQEFLNAAGILATTGQKRSHTWDAFPAAVDRALAGGPTSSTSTPTTAAASVPAASNQTGVAQAAAAASYYNVGDLFNAEIADTFEAGFKSHWMDGRLLLNGSVYLTEDHNDYYFVFLASNSTQNLGNIKKVQFIGFDLDLTARLDDFLMLNAGFGYTDSEVEAFPSPDKAITDLVVGSRAPLVSVYTLNIGPAIRPSDRPGTGRFMRGSTTT